MARRLPEIGAPPKHANARTCLARSRQPDEWPPNLGKSENHVQKLGYQAELTTVNNALQTMPP
ncbi:MAG: hypothetical protein EBR45_13215 [Betaproteobacteria bacterium]|jgi:hypothetical protein|nr:hypothetical protein [Betaproteobacteria bacterium]